MTLEEITEAEIQIIKEVHVAAFNEELRILEGDHDLPKTSKLIALNPFVDQNQTIRVGGHLKKVNIPEKSNYPIILPGSHHATKLLIDWIHKRNGHVGAEHVLSLLREEYWVTGARTAIKTAIRHRVICNIR